ncbi:hypothetical protein BGZ49_009034 [Haplosporangium sp. Z 27]|nr:hypothetical protein BGZ49_009034 [Haplosporangium sp. Z 27]
MVFLTQRLAQGLVLSLSLSSSIFISSCAQAATSTTAPKPTGTATATGTATPTPTTAVPSVSAPSAFIGLASASNNNNIFYQGGQLNSGTVQYTNELFSLDTTKSWPITNPAWTNLTSAGAPVTGSHSATMSSDGTTLLVTAPFTSGVTYLYQYNINTATWSGVNTPSAQTTTWVNRTGTDFVTDPNTGASWLLGGTFPNGASTNEVDKFQNGAWNAAVALTASAGTSTLNNFNSGTAHIFNNKIYIFGGFMSTTGQRSYQSFQSLPVIDVNTLTTGTQLTLGAVPPPRQNHCSVLTVSHKVIIYGGYDANTNLSLNDIWSLDLITMTWTQIVQTPSNPSSPRHGHSCNIAGANMVVFGGVASIAGQTTLIGYVKDTQVYDVMLSQWMSSYAPKQDTTPVSVAPGSSGSGSSSGLSTGAIIGIVVGVIVVVGGGLGLFVYKRRQKHIEIREAELEKEAYLASLRPEGGDQFNKSLHSPVVSTPGMTHSGGGYNGMDELLLSNASGSPGGGQGNVQYLMQHLPDGTIAVQPVYLDHQGIQQHSPNMGSGDDGGYISPMLSATQGGSGGYYAPPSGQSQTPHVTYPQPTHDPFASPVMPNVPLPPGYLPGSSNVGSPQQLSGQLR